MHTTLKNGKYLKFFIYLIAVVLINIAGLTLFFRVDLTANRLYSLSAASKKVVSTLAEPLTIKVFFTKDLPAPHNNTERYLHDLLEEYALSSNRHFNYRFYDVNPDEGSLDDQTRQNQELAQAYGINPVQIQRVEADEVGFQRAYMGLVLIHGDMVERIGAVTSTDGLEYKLTTAIQKLNNKISAMLNLEDKIQLKLYFSSSLNAVAPLMQLQDLKNVPEKIESIVAKLNKKNYDNLTFQLLDPDKEPSLYEEVEKHQLLSLKWPAVPKHQIDAGRGAIGLVISHGEKTVSVPILQVLNIPLIGTHYEMADLDNLEEVVDNALEKVVSINEDLGYLADHGTLGVPAPSPRMPQGQSNIMTFRDLAGQTYTVRDINLEKETIPSSLNALIIARPTKEFTDYELFQIDQFLMRGNNLILFPDHFQEVMPGGQQQMMMGGQTAFVPIETGLERLLSHWGVNVGESYVLDENSFKQNVSQQMGGGQQPIYFAPLIMNQNINKEIDFIKDIKGMVVLKASPIHIDESRVDQIDVKAHRLISSSDKSWVMKAPINLNPMMMSPPPENEKRDQFHLAYLLEGQFPSYFEGKSIPVRTVKETPEEETTDPAENKDSEERNASGKEEKAKKSELADVERTDAFIAKGQPARIFVMAASDMISDTILDREGRSPNAVFMMNMIDALNGREEIAVMRSKTQRLNPLNAPPAGFKTIIKTFNIVGLPIIVVIFGLLVWMRRHARKKRIQMVFQTK
jgi:ABC-type uncharacterized transport system involved in gliding motility auxiliary subunit